MSDAHPRRKSPWLNRTVIGIGLASLCSDWSHEIATTLMPAFLATMGVAAAWVGLIEGVSDGLSSFAKLASGHYTDRLQRRKGIAVAGYVVTALGTAAFGLASSAWHALLARATAWLGRGVRTPVRKALLAGAVTKDTYGRAFGFERMMDTLGAIVGPASAFALLPLVGHHYPTLFALTLIPGLLAAGLIAFVVKEKVRTPVPHISFGESLLRLPSRFRRFLIAVGLFGSGDFAHTLLILLAMQTLTPDLGAVAAASIATGLYVLHNVLYAAFSMIAGWLADHFNKGRLLATGYFLAALMALAIIYLPLNIWTLAIVFALGGVYVAMEETLEDSFCAELTEESNHGMAFGTLATVNGVGDFASSIIVGVLWTGFGTSIAFGYSAVLFLCGSLMVLRAASGTKRHGAGSPQHCTINSVRERVLAEQSGGPLRATEEGPPAPSANGPAVFEVVIVCDQKKYFGVFTRGGKFDPPDFDTGHAVRVHIDAGKIRIENRKGNQATGQLTAER